MRKLIVLMMVLCVASVASAAVYNHTVTITGTVGAQDDADPTTFSIENRYVVTGDAGVLVGADLIVVTPLGRNVYDDVCWGGAGVNDEATYIAASVNDDLESYVGNEWGAGMYGDYIALGTPPIVAHADPVAGPLPAEVSCGATDTALSSGLLANFGYDGGAYVPLEFVGLASEGPGKFGVKPTDPNFNPEADTVNVTVVLDGVYVPEPATMLLLALGGLAGLIRRR